MTAKIEGSTLLNYNPANISEVVSEHPLTQDAQAMVQRSAQAFDLWSKTPIPDRAKVLAKAAQIYTENKEKFSQTLHQENGKPVDEARGEIQEVIDTLEFFAGEGRRLYGLVGNSEMPNKAIYTIREPIGPALLITAWNFPAAVPSWKVAPALISGNSVILKPSENAPLSGKIFIDTLNEAGLPANVAQLAVGGAELAKELLASEDIKIVSFTGSTAVGRQIAEAAASGFKKCALELGGKNSSIIMPDANLDLVREGLVWGAFGTAGQRCTSTSRLIISKASANILLPQFIKDIATLYDKEKDTPSDKYCPIITSKQLAKIDSLVQEAIAEGAELLCGGKILDDGSKKGFFYEPTILRVKPDMKIVKTEVFGPVLALIELDDCEPEEFLNKAMTIANDTVYGLSNSIFTESLNLGMRALKMFESGLVYLNAPTIGAECGGASFFGGWKQTGNGSREGGLAALDTYTQYKTISIDYSASLQKAQISNY